MKSLKKTHPKIRILRPPGIRYGFPMELSVMYGGIISKQLLLKEAKSVGF
jgi:hypothetical protein